MSVATSDGSRVNLGAAVGFKVRDGKGSRYGTNPFSWLGFHRQLSRPLCELEQFYERTRSHRQFGIRCNGYETLTSHVQRDFPRGSAGSVDGYAGVNSSIDVLGLDDRQRAL